MLELDCRRALLHEAAEISDLLNSAYRGDSSREGWTTEADLVDGERANSKTIELLIEESGSLFILAQEKGSNMILGCVHVKEEDAGTLYFGMLAVRPKLQAHGIGKVLISEVQKYAEEKKLKRIRITVINFRQELIAYYNRLSFLTTGKDEPFPFEPLIKVKGLRLLELVKEI